MKDGEAMKTALANIKKLAKQSIVERYKKKGAPPPKEAPKALPQDEAIEEEPAELEDEVADGEGDGEEKAHVELIVMAGKRPKSEHMEKAAAEVLPKKRGRPPKKK